MAMSGCTVAGLDTEKWLGDAWCRMARVLGGAAVGAPEARRRRAEVEAEVAKRRPECGRRWLVAAGE